jgi:hypothetical protein
MAIEEIITLLESLNRASRLTSGGLLTQLPAVAAELESGAIAQEQRKAAGETKSNPERSRSTLGSILGPVARTLGRGLTLAPVIGGLIKLFGGGREEQPEPELERFALPPAIRAEAGLDRSGDTFLIDRGIGGEIRRLPGFGESASATGTIGAILPAPQFSGNETIELLVRQGSGRAGGVQSLPIPPDRPAIPVPIVEAGTGAFHALMPKDERAMGEGGRGPLLTAPAIKEQRENGATTITVNVQAMDSQSFLDRREDIARAVREAMLHSHSVNDVVSEL